MHSRHLFLIGYDVRQPSRRSRVLRDVQQHALGGQKSFYECWLSISELQTLLSQLRSRLDDTEDRVVVIRLDARTQSVHLGQAQPVAQADYFHIA